MTRIVFTDWKRKGMKMSEKGGERETPKVAGAKVKRERRRSRFKE